MQNREIWCDLYTLGARTKQILLKHFANCPILATIAFINALFMYIIGDITVFLLCSGRV